jgi:hypothetical protein
MLLLLVLRVAIRRRTSCVRSKIRRSAFPARFFEIARTLLREPRSRNATERKVCWTLEATRGVDMESRGRLWDPCVEKFRGRESKPRAKWDPAIPSQPRER